MAAPAGQAPAAEPPPVLPGVPPGFVTMLIIGRGIFILTVVLFLVLRHPFAYDRTSVFAVGVAAVIYNVAQWLLLRAGRMGRYPPILFVGVDLVLVTAIVWSSGGTTSPFLGLFYLLIIVSAAFGDLRGALLTATAVSLLLLGGIAAGRPGAVNVLRIENAISTFPYFYLTAAVAGFLVRALRAEWSSRRAIEVELATVNGEFEVAEKVQRALMDRPLPRVPGLEIARYVKPLYGVGGDLQQYVALPDGLGLVLADVAGHSLAAALLAVRLSQALETAGLGPDLDEVMSTWNRIVYEYTPDDVFATAVFIQVRPTQGTMRYALAGHPPALLWRCASRSVETLNGCGGPPLGVVRQGTFTPNDLRLEPGDTLLLYTDGVIEARDAGGAMLDTAGLARILERHGHLPPEELVGRLCEDVLAERQVRDDLTLLAITREPSHR